MSRYTTKTKYGDELAFGYDKTCGYFVQVFKSGEDEPYIDLDSNGFTPAGPQSNSSIYEAITKELNDSGKCKFQGKLEMLMIDVPF